MELTTENLKKYIEDSSSFRTMAIEHLIRLESRIAELKQQNAELSKDKARLAGLIKIMSTDNGDYFCFDHYDDGWNLILNDGISRSSVSVGNSQIEAIDAAISNEQDGYEDTSEQLGPWY